MKVVIPMAGYGTRLRPHTYSRPKPLVNIAGQPVLKHVLDSLDGLKVDEYIFIVGYLGDQIREYINENYPDAKAHFVVQEEMKGQSHAIYLAKDYLTGPAVILFSDTLFDADIHAILDSDADGIIYVKEVDDPRSFGVVSVDSDGNITKLIEKPDNFDNRKAVVGMYYLRESEKLMTAIKQQIDDDQIKNGEYFIADALQNMIDKGAKIKTEEVSVWLDAGKPDTVLETHRYLLETGFDNSAELEGDGNVIIPPVYIHPSAKVNHSIIGPYTTISANCDIRHSIIRDSIINEGAKVSDTTLEQSLIGEDATIKGRYHSLNVGDKSSLDFS